LIAFRSYRHLFEEPCLSNLLSDSFRLHGFT
jgi:hypothetical protein